MALRPHPGPPPIGGGHRLHHAPHPRSGADRHRPHGAPRRPRRRPGAGEGRTPKTRSSSSSSVARWRPRSPTRPRAGPRMPTRFSRNRTVRSRFRNARSLRHARPDRWTRRSRGQRPARGAPRARRPWRSARRMLVQGQEVSLRSARATSRAGSRLPARRSPRRGDVRQDVGPRERDRTLAGYRDAHRLRRPAPGIPDDPVRDHRARGQDRTGDPVMSLSGGSQQKVLCRARRWASPRAARRGSDAGSTPAPAWRSTHSSGRSQIRASPSSCRPPTPSELEGLCDRVLVFSRGHIQATLVGGEVTERANHQRRCLVDQGVPQSTSSARSQRTPLPEPVAVRGELQAGALVGLDSGAGRASHAGLHRFHQPPQCQSAARRRLRADPCRARAAAGGHDGGIDLSVGSVVALSTVVISFFGSRVRLFLGRGPADPRRRPGHRRGQRRSGEHGCRFRRLSRRWSPRSRSSVWRRCCARRPEGSSASDIMAAIGTTVAGIPWSWSVAVGLALPAVVHHPAHGGRTRPARGRVRPGQGQPDRSGFPHADVRWSRPVCCAAIAGSC